MVARLPASLLTLTMRPQRRLRMPGATAWAIAHAPNRLVSKILRTLSRSAMRDVFPIVSTAQTASFDGHQFESRRTEVA